MSILKKITDKYISLRFLNKKTTKLCLLSAALVGLCLSSGYSFAKYRDENYGGGNAGAAKFGDVLIYSDYSRIQIPKNLSYDADYGFYAFVASFRLEFQSSEVQRSYSLNLRMSQRSNNLYDLGVDENGEKIAFPSTKLSSFVLSGGTGNVENVNSFKTVISSSGVGTVQKVFAPLTSTNEEDIWNEIGKAYYPDDNAEDRRFQYNKIYCAYAVNDESYKWVNKNISDVSSISQDGVMNELKLVDNGNMDSDLLTQELALGLSSVTHRFKIVYFSHFDQDQINSKLLVENFKMLSDLSIYQNGGEA